MLRVDVRELLVSSDEVRIELDRLAIQLDCLVVVARPVIEGAEGFRRLRRDRIELESLLHLREGFLPTPRVAQDL